MVDNVTIPAQGTGTTTPSIATDDVGGVHYQVIKHAVGGDGVANMVSNSNPIPISDAAGSLTVDNAGTFAVQAAQSGAWTVAATQSGTWNIATVTSVSAISGALPAGNNNIGDVDMVSAPADPFGTNADVATSGAGSINAHLRQIAAVGIPITGTVTVGSHPVTNAGAFAVQADGSVAHDGIDAGSPVKVGARARTSEITPVANNDRTDLIADIAGKLITLPYSNPENMVSGAITTAMTGTTSTSLVAAPGAGLRNYITTLIVSNSHATQGTDVIIQDGSGGTTLLTIPAAAVFGGATVTLPTPLRQPTANTALFAANVTTGANTKVSAVGYKGA